MRKRTRETLTPDLTPLIDVVFLLLIFFMVSTVFKSDELALLLNLPNSKQNTKKSVSKNIINIELSIKKLALNGTIMTLDQLNTNLQKVSSKKLPVHFRVDQNVTYKKIVKILDIIKNNKLNNLSLITKQN